MLTEDKKSEIISTLEKRITKNGKPLKCPMCEEDSFILAEQYIRIDLQESLHNISIGGPSIPATSIICRNCGFISLHALGAIGLFEKKESNDGDK